MMDLTLLFNALLILLAHTIPALLAPNFLSVPAVLQILAVDGMIWVYYALLPMATRFLTVVTAQLRDAAQPVIVASREGRMTPQEAMRTIALVLLRYAFEELVRRVLEWILGFRFWTLPDVELVWRRGNDPISRSAAWLGAYAFGWIDRGALEGRPLTPRELIRYQLEQATIERQGRILEVLRIVGRANRREEWDGGRVADMVVRWVQDLDLQQRAHAAENGGEPLTAEELARLQENGPFVENVPEAEQERLTQLMGELNDELDSDESEEEE